MVYIHTGFFHNVYPPFHRCAHFNKRDAIKGPENLYEKISYNYSAPCENIGDMLTSRGDLSPK